MAGRPHPRAGAAGRAAAQVPYRAIDLDSAACQQGNRGGQIRAALKANGVPFDESFNDDPYGFLPTWPHPR